jgi:hypothetical protein
LTSGIVTLEEMRALMPFVCGGGACVSYSGCRLFRGREGFGACRSRFRRYPAASAGITLERYQPPGTWLSSGDARASAWWMEIERREKTLISHVEAIGTGMGHARGAAGRGRTGGSQSDRSNRRLPWPWTAVRKGSSAPSWPRRLLAGVGRGEWLIAVPRSRAELRVLQCRRFRTKNCRIWCGSRRCGSFRRWPKMRRWTSSAWTAARLGRCAFWLLRFRRKCWTISRRNAPPFTGRRIGWFSARSLRRRCSVAAIRTRSAGCWSRCWPRKPI